MGIQESLIFNCYFFKTFFFRIAIDFNSSQCKEKFLQVTEHPVLAWLGSPFVKVWWSHKLSWRPFTQSLNLAKSRYWNDDQSYYHKRRKIKFEGRKMIQLFNAVTFEARNQMIGMVSFQSHFEEVQMKWNTISLLNWIVHFNSTWSFHYDFRSRLFLRCRFCSNEKVLISRIPVKKPIYWRNLQTILHALFDPRNCKSRVKLCEFVQNKMKI